MTENFFSFLGGENSNISPLIHPKDNPVILNGCNNTWKIGTITKDTGYEIKGTALESGKSIGGLFNFIQVPGTEKMLATVDDSTSDDTQLFYSTGTTWTEIATAETAWANFAGVNVEMESFIGYCFFVGYSSTDGFLPVLSLTGTTTSTSTNVTSMPKAKYIKRYRDRLYVANCEIGSTDYPFRVYFSSVPSAGAITWTVATDFLDVDFSDQITGIGTIGDNLVIFTDYSAYLYNQTSFKKVWATGCSNHRTIANSGAYTIWANGRGAWLSTGGQPQNISGEIQDFIRAANPRNMFATIIDEEYHLYLGDVTVDGVNYTNCTKIFNIPMSAWRTREYYNNMTIFARYNSSGSERLWMGSTTGQVWDKGKYTDATLLSSDAMISGVGQPISSNFLLPPIHLNDISATKKIHSLYAYADRSQGLNLQTRVINRNTQSLTPFRPIGKLKDFVSSFQVSADTGAILQVAGSEYGKKPYWSFYGFSVEVERDGDILKKQ